MERKVYFTQDKIALGTSEGGGSYYGDYYANEIINLPEDYPVKGRTFTELKDRERAERKLRLQARKLDR